mmetsp:Transcript_41714/g.116264  ORF Transcript_41714/g.116264 Transcript_41714/m.116264 type:complete len:251 (+) Transcript_41714:409-1161(+)
MARPLSARKRSAAYLRARPCCRTARSTTSRSERSSEPRHARTSPRWLTAARTTSRSARKIPETYGNTPALSCTAASTKLRSACNVASAYWKASSFCRTAVSTSSLSDFSSCGTSESMMPKRPTRSSHMACCSVRRTRVRSMPVSSGTCSWPSEAVAPQQSPELLSSPPLAPMPAKAAPALPTRSARVPSSSRSSSSTLVPVTRRCSRQGTPVETCTAFFSCKSGQSLSAETTHAEPPKLHTRTSSAMAPT